VHLPLVNLACVTRADGKNEILKNRWQKITSMEDLLSSRISGHMTTTSTKVVVI